MDSQFIIKLESHYDEVLNSKSDSLVFIEASYRQPRPVNL